MHQALQKSVGKPHLQNGESSLTHRQTAKSSSLPPTLPMPSPDMLRGANSGPQPRPCTSGSVGRRGRDLLRGRVRERGQRDAAPARLGYFFVRHGDVFVGVVRPPQRVRGGVRRRPSWSASGITGACRAHSQFLAASILMPFSFASSCGLERRPMSPSTTKD